MQKVKDDLNYEKTGGTADVNQVGESTTVEGEGDRVLQSYPKMRQKEEEMVPSPHLCSRDEIAIRG